jgi:hypothetical protein
MFIAGELLRNLCQNFFFPAKCMKPNRLFRRITYYFIEWPAGIDYAVDTITAGQASQGRVVATCL